VTTHSYVAAKARLEHGISLLVTELELDDYNGLQLALRAQSYSIPALVVGRHDDVLERDAEQLGATFVRKDELDRNRLLIAIDVKLETARHSAPLVFRSLEAIRRPASELRLAALARRMLLH
jgi:hypothetical protein